MAFILVGQALALASPEHATTRAQRRLDGQEYTVQCYFHAGAPAASVCPHCLRGLCAACAAQHSPCAAASVPAPSQARQTTALDGSPGACCNHPFTPARALCARCGRPICKGCAEPVEGRLICPDCLPLLPRRGRTGPYDGQPAHEGLDLSRIHYSPKTDAVQATRNWLIVVAAVAAIAVLAFGLASGAGLAARAAATASPIASPAESVRQHYALVDAQDFRAAWELLSPRSRSHLDYDAWVSAFEGTRVTTRQVAVVSQSASTATVAVTVLVVSRDGSRSVTLRGTWEVVLHDGAWKLDTPSLEPVESLPTI